MLQVEGSQAGGMLSYSGRVNLPIIVEPSAVWMRATHIRKAIYFTPVYQVFSHPKILFQAHLEKKCLNSFGPVKLAQAG